MTYDPNDPRQRVVHESEGIGPGAMIAVAVAIVLALSALFFAINEHQNTAFTPNAPTTTGQDTRMPDGPKTPERTPSPPPTPPAPPQTGK
jgi:hypothetical protein